MAFGRNLLHAKVKGIRSTSGMLLGLWVAASAGAAERVYEVDPTASAVTIRVGRAGLFKFAGHEHEVVVGELAGVVRADPEALERSSVALSFAAAGLRVTGRGEPPEDVPKVEAAMRGPAVLDVARFPEIAFASHAVSGVQEGEEYALTIDGTLALRGVTRPLRVPVRVTLGDETLTAAGRLELRLRDFGISPPSVAGLVKVRNELAIAYRIVARAAR